MDSPRPAIDLEKELTCSICTELLYQPLTLLDCLHTFCGACLKEWFGWQAAAAETAPVLASSPLGGGPVYTCPACRSEVRDTRHNATVATLLDMFVAASPDRARSAEERAEMEARYTPGEKVLREVRRGQRTEEEEEERRVLEEVRAMSLREVMGGGGGGGRGERRSRRGEEDSSRRRPRSDGRQDGSGDESSDGRSSRGRRVEHQSSIRSLISAGGMSPRDIDREIEAFARQIQEEGLLEGLDLDNIDLSNNDELSRKVTEAYRRRQRQRQRAARSPAPEGAPPPRRRRSDASGHSHHSHRSDSAAAPESRSHLGGSSSSRTGSRQRQGVGSRSSSSQAVEDRSRPPTSSGAATHLEVQQPRQRRRTTSGARSATVPVGPTTAAPDARVAARSQTDLSIRTGPHAGEARHGRPAVAGESRSSSTPTLTGGMTESPATQSLPFHARAAAAAAALGSMHGLGIVSGTSTPPTQPSTTQPSTMRATQTNYKAQHAQPAPERRHRPADILTTVPAPVSSAATTSFPSPGLVSPAVGSPGLGSPALVSPLSFSHPKRPRQLYPEPSLTCKRCARPHIEYEVHYNCSVCHAGAYNICLDCYRRAKGCLHWFGFGYGAWDKWDRARQSLSLSSSSSMAQQQQQQPEPPHVLTANRYRPPPTTPGGAEGRVTLTARDPAARLESGTFCARCLAWANGCFWRCDVCNEGDWGFCHACVGAGRCCGHALLPLTYADDDDGCDAEGRARAAGPRVEGRPADATVAGRAIGPFRALVFASRCEVCWEEMAPATERVHCFTCPATGSVEGGQWEVCSGCYGRLEAEGRISAENGAGGWRRCLAGHRTAVVGFAQGSRDGAWRRRVVRDRVGGRRLGFEAYDGTAGLQVCYWFDGGGRRVERLVTAHVADTAADPDADVGVVRSRWTEAFPPDGGSGTRAAARWAWYPAAGADDELPFPKGAEITEIEDVNGEWFHGVYMGAKGLFPAVYVVPVSGHAGHSGHASG